MSCMKSASTIAPPERTPGTEALCGNYFISVYPPFSTWTEESLGEVESQLGEEQPGKPLGIYVHIPFCQKKCDYCYYLSYAGTPAGSVDSYLNALRSEIGIYAALPALKGRRPSFIYAGGGTPSILAPAEIRTLGRLLRDGLGLGAPREFTFECAPLSTRPETVAAMREIGVTRASLGIQSLDVDLLLESGRAHLPAEAVRACALLKKAGFQTVNVDLMAGMPGESWDQWKDTVLRAVSLGPDSITVYQTEIPFNTRLYRRLAGGQPGETARREADGGGEPGSRLPALASWTLKRERIGFAFEELEKAGYTVTSAYSAVKDPSRHPFVYQEELWRGGDMLGLGVASYSYLDGVHFQNSDRLSEYQSRLSRGALPLRRARRLTAQERLIRELILGLKWGSIGRRSFKKKFGVDVLNRFSCLLKKLGQEGWLETSPSGAHLTRAGLIRIDALLPRFFLPEHRGIRYT